MKKNNWERGDIYLLWGNDAEMQHIKKKLDKNDQEYIDKNLWWWADVESYNDDIKNILQNWDTPVWIELTWADKIEWVVDIDHHNEKAYMPAAITQVMERLWLKMSLYDELIAANDSWFIPEMEKRIDQEKERITKKLWEEWFEKVKKKLIENVRQKDRFAQWITKEQEEQAEESIKNREDCYNWNLTIIRLPHSKWATVTDRLYWTYKNLLILSEDWEINFYWDWKICSILKWNNEWSWAWWEWLWEKWWNAFWWWYVDQKELEKDIRYRIKEWLAHAEVIKNTRTEDEYRAMKESYINSMSDNMDWTKEESIQISIPKTELDLIEEFNKMLPKWAFGFNEWAYYKERQRYIDDNLNTWTKSSIKNTWWYNSLYKKAENLSESDEDYKLKWRQIKVSNDNFGNPLKGFSWIRSRVRTEQVNKRKNYNYNIPTEFVYDNKYIFEIFWTKQDYKDALEYLK